jgi:hypothetical protein
LCSEFSRCSSSPLLFFSHTSKLFVSSSADLFASFNDVTNGLIASDAVRAPFETSPVFLPDLWPAQKRLSRYRQPAFAELLALRH